MKLIINIIIKYFLVYRALLLDLYNSIVKWAITKTMINIILFLINQNLQVHDSKTLEIEKSKRLLSLALVLWSNNDHKRFFS